MEKVLQMFCTWRHYKKFDYLPEDKLRMFLNEDWIIERNIFMNGVLNIKNKISNINTNIIRNTLLFTDMDYAEALCMNLLEQQRRFSEELTRG
jgi:hypothetical protein